MDTYTLGDAARILKVSPARLRYWQRAELVQPRSERSGSKPASGVGAPTPGGAAKAADFEFRDLVVVRGILALLEQGIPLRRIRRNVEALRTRLPELDDPVRALRLWVEGSERIVVRHDGVLLEPDGQMVLDFGDGTGLAEDVTPIDASADPTARRLEEAAEWFERGCRLDSDPDTYAEAVAAYEAALALVPDFADCHCNLGAVYYNRGERKPARRRFERCLEIDEHHVEAHFNLANLLEEEGCQDMALRHYRAALAADPLYPDLHINLALLYEKLAQPERALEHWRRYLQLDADGAWSEVARQRLEKLRNA